jgi:hypothetical protein
MRRRRLPVLLAANAVTLLALCAGMPTLAAPSARADPDGHHRETRAGESAHRRADSSQVPTSVGIRVLPGVSGPGLGPGWSDPGRPSSAGWGEDGHSAGAHSESDNGISADLDSAGKHESWSHNGSGDQSHGNPRFARPHSRGHRARHSPRHHAPLHGYLPFTGQNMMIDAITGAATVLVGSALLWASSKRRRRAG